MALIAKDLFAPVLSSVSFRAISHTSALQQHSVAAGLTNVFVCRMPRSKALRPTILRSSYQEPDVRVLQQDCFGTWHEHTVQPDIDVGSPGSVVFEAHATDSHAAHLRHLLTETSISKAVQPAWLSVAQMHGVFTFPVHDPETCRVGHTAFRSTASRWQDQCAAQLSCDSACGTQPAMLTSLPTAVL